MSETEIVTNQYEPYEPKNVESRMADFWEKNEFYKANPRSTKEKYVIVLPPPNVTGVLHIGHALTCTLEDILVRRKRMQGYETLWVPGTDHAGIATQMVVERALQKEEKLSRHDLGREKFLEKVWEWKEKSQNTIVGQLKLMGCSLDWSRLQFTLDENVSLAVRETFFRLFNEKLIYRKKAMIQWCPRCHTALSDLEVKHKEVKGKFWQIRYPKKNDPNDFVIIATTRPETLLGDTAVAVNPDDERYTSLVGQKVIVPLVNREVPVIGDAYIDKTFGTGALKVTPAHDINDYEIAARHQLDSISIFDESAKIKLPGDYQGLTREKAREKIVADLEAQGLLVKTEDHNHSVGHCDRCSTVVEPWLSYQWFMNAEELAKEAIRVVSEKEIQILPEEWEKTYFEWMRNIRPWCISRQLWWGHRIPVWYCEQDHMTVAVTDPTSCQTCASKNLRQESDVLDTWFSSGLWPFSTLGWPKQTEDFAAFYPNSVMETGFDILFFWVARMIMLGIKMTGKSPFHTVYLHPMVRDEYGQKMSKTKGNVKDPLDIIGTMGADALRFTLASMAVHGRDVLLSDSRIEGYRNFVNKIWNATRFVSMHFGSFTESKRFTEDEVNQWIWSRFNQVKKEVNQALDQYRFFEAADKMYHFIWSDYCDWYIEFIKLNMEERKTRGDTTALEVLEESLRLIHPFMPYVTEAIWQKLVIKPNEKTISLAAYPQFKESDHHAESDRKISRLIAVVEAIRSKRGENTVPVTREIHVAIVAEPQAIKELQAHAATLSGFVKAKAVTWQKPQGKVPQVMIPVMFRQEVIEVFVPRDEMVDVEVEKPKVLKEKQNTEAELQRAVQKLQSESFLSSAPPDVVLGVKERKVVLEKKLASLEAYWKLLLEP